MKGSGAYQEASDTCLTSQSWSLFIKRARISMHTRMEGLVMNDFGCAQQEDINRNTLVSWAIRIDQHYFLRLLERQKLVCVFLFSLTADH